MPQRQDIGALPLWQHFMPAMPGIFGIGIPAIAIFAHIGQRRGVCGLA